MSLVDILAGPIFKIIDKVIPDPQARANAQLELLRLQQAGEFKELEIQLALAQGQMAINLEEAKSESLFKSGWRPAVGWLCVLALGYTYLARPLFTWYSLAHKIPSPPELDIGDLIVLLCGLLGLGTLRTAEKIKKV